MEAWTVIERAQASLEIFQQRGGERGEYFERKRQMILLLKELARVRYQHDAANRKIVFDFIDRIRD